MEEEKNVHTEHCCAEHGCKYGDDNCPVETGKQKQSYRCEACEWQDEAYENAMRMGPAKFRRAPRL